MSLKNWSRTKTVTVDGYDFTFTVPTSAARIDAELAINMVVVPADASDKERGNAIKEERSVINGFLADHFVESTLVDPKTEEPFTAADFATLEGQDVSAIFNAFGNALRPSQAEVPKSEGTAQ